MKTDGTRSTLLDIKNILEIGDEWRKKYGKKSGGFELVGFSLRDSISVVRRYAKTRDVRKAFIDVYDDFRKNPIDGLDAQYQALVKLLDSKLP